MNEECAGKTSAPADNGLRFGGVTPILRVSDLAASLAYYIDQLGFEFRWRDGSNFAAVGRQDVNLMLCQGDQGQTGSWVYVGISDADAYHQELLARGVAIRHPPTNYPWLARELQVEDPDGHVLRFASEATDNHWGPFRDGEGRLWFPQADGGWVSG